MANERGREETDLVNFLKTLTDGYIRPEPEAVGR
jgi:hypothetical protein